MKLVKIETYVASFETEIIRLILEIQQTEFNIKINLHDQPDLENITTFYQRGNGNFWVAFVNKTVVGTIALYDIGNNQVALRKMFVKKEFRGASFGIGQTLLNTAINWAKEKRVTKILLGTTAQFIAAQHFYLKNGFQEIDKTSLPASFPVMQVDVKFFEYVKFQK